MIKHYLQGAFEIAGEFLNLLITGVDLLITFATEPVTTGVRSCVIVGWMSPAVMDEYCHLTKGQKGTLDATVNHMRDTVNLQLLASTLTV